MPTSPWPIIHAERTALADDLADLSDEQWATPSLCEGWTVHQMLGHLTATAKMTPPRFAAKMLTAGLRFNTMTAKEVARETASGPAQTLQEFRAHLQDTTAPPGPVEAMLGEAVIHSEDIRRPLHISHNYPMDAVVRVGDFYRRSNLIVGAKRRIAGLTLTATDTDWSTGSGPEVRGPMLSLVLAMTGRAAALADLAGEGTATLSSRR